MSSTEADACWKRRDSSIQDVRSSFSFFWLFPVKGLDEPLANGYRKAGVGEMRVYLILVVLPLVALGLILARQFAAMGADGRAVTATLSTKTPADFTVTVPCVLGGSGEDVNFVGNIHVLAHETADGRGGHHLVVEANAAGVSGTGLISGNTYRLASVAKAQLNVATAAEASVVVNFRIVGRGLGNASVLHATLHLTVNPQGAVTSAVANVRADCVPPTPTAPLPTPPTPPPETPPPAETPPEGTPPA